MVGGPLGGPQGAPVLPLLPLWVDVSLMGIVEAPITIK